MSKVSEPCSPKLRKCVDDLIAQGKPESSAWAICKAQLNEKLREAKTANVCGTCNWVEDDPKEPIETCPICGAKAYFVPVLHPQESFKHPDFQKIQTQFIQQCGQEEGLRRYQEWVDRLGLDESKSYLANATMREKFQWIQRHADFRLWKEDIDAKYWRVEAGFPLQSMNENVYTKEELTRAARTIKGKTVNLNHKFSLPTVEILAGEYESDIVECVVRVPNGLHCPICDRTKTINDLIESRGIVNVSLEAACDYGTGPHGECEGMNFTGLSLLTKDVLPGIPLTRLMPLESIMVEALRVNETKAKKVRRIEAKMAETKKKEADSPGDVKGGECPEGYHMNEAGECVKDVPRVDTEVETEKGKDVLSSYGGEELVLKAADEEVKRIKAEGNVKSMELQVSELSKSKIELEKQVQNLKGKCDEQKNMIDKLEKQKEQADKDLIEAKAENETWKRKRDEISGSRDDYKNLSEKSKAQLEQITEKYNNALDKNLELSKKLTEANEDYIKISKENEDLKEALSRAKNEAKKIIRVVA